MILYKYRIANKSVLYGKVSGSLLEKIKETY